MKIKKIKNYNSPLNTINFVNKYRIHIEYKGVYKNKVKGRFRSKLRRVHYESHRDLPCKLYLFFRKDFLSYKKGNFTFTLIWKSKSLNHRESGPFYISNNISNDYENRKKEFPTISKEYALRGRFCVKNDLVKYKLNKLKSDGILV